MRKRSLTSLGETEMEVLHHVWSLGEATVADVRTRILEEREVAYTTIMTVMKNLAEKGYLQYHKEGVAYVYAPARSAQDVQRSLLGDLIQKVFNGSPQSLAQALVQQEDLSAEDLADIRAMIDQMNDADD